MSDDKMTKSAILAQKIENSVDFKNTFSAIIADVLSGEITPPQANAACNAGGKVLKVVEMEQRYGTRGENKERTLKLTTPSPE